MFTFVTDVRQERINLIFQALTLVEMIGTTPLTLLPYLFINKVIRLILFRSPFLLRFKKIKKIRLCITSVCNCNFLYDENIFSRFYGQRQNNLGN